MAQQEFCGVLFDMFEEVVIERSPVIRATYAEAMADAKALIPVVNQMAEDADDDNTMIGRFDETYCFVAINGRIAYSKPPRSWVKSEAA